MFACTELRSVHTEPRRAKRISRPPALPFLSRIPVPHPLSPNSHRIISFADHHPLTPIESYRYKNVGGGGHLQLSRLGTSKTASRIHFSFQPLTNCKFHNSFLLIFMQNAGGCMGCWISLTFGLSDLRTIQRVSELSPVFSNSCALFCTSLHSRITQLFCFQAIPHSFTSQRGWWARFPGFPICHSANPPRSPRLSVIIFRPAIPALVPTVSGSQVIYPPAPYPPFPIPIPRFFTSLPPYLYPFP